MPPVKQPQRPKESAPKGKPSDGPTPADVLVLLQQNLDLMRRWYRGARTAGPEMGGNVLMEFNLGCTCTALELAMQGKRWEPPTPSP